jgi:HSP20 family molecular chaperone IbpA
LQIQNKHEHDVMDKVNHNEEVLKKLHKNVQDTKDITHNEMQRITGQHQIRKDQLQKDFESNFANAAESNALRLNDLNHAANLEIQRLQRKMELKKDLLEKAHANDEKVIKDAAKTRLEMKKDVYSKKQFMEEDKYHKALKNQKKAHTNQLNNEERKHQKTIANRKKIYDNTIKKLHSDAVKKKQGKQAHFEKDYKHLYNKHEKTLQALVGNKEKLMHSLKKDLWKGYKLGIEKSKDPFYDFGKLEPQIKATEKGYELSLPVAEHEAQHVNLKAEERTLTLSLARRHEFKKEDENGTSNKMNKYESYISDIPVEKIIDPKTLQKSYQDGKIIFTVAYK